MLTEGDEILLLHNPRCSKSRGLWAALEERGVEFRERRYLEQPLRGEELDELVRRLGLPLVELVRLGEAQAKEAGLSRSSSDGELRAALLAHPELLQRPVLVRGQRAAIGRPDPGPALDLL